MTGKLSPWPRGLYPFGSAAHTRALNDVKATILNRKLHRWGAVLTFLPFLLVVLTGILLQIKKQSNWIQPPTAVGSGSELSVGFDAILAAVSSIEEAGLKSWDDVDRLDVRPDKGVVKVRGKNRWEVQVDTVTGAVLQSAYRRSDLIESLHDGSWFHDSAKLWIFLPCGILLFGMWITGVYLWLLPHLARRRKNQRAP